MPPKPPSRDIKPIVRRKLSDEVADRLKQMIVAGEYRPGDVLPSERDMMKLFGVGRPAIREAMQTLDAIGLVAVSHGERAKVLQLTARSVTRSVDAAASMLLSTTPDSLEHLKAARLFFERGMVREAAGRATPADIQRLRASIETQRAAIGDVEQFMTADMAFHCQIAAISRNPIFEAVSEAMLGWLRQYHVELLVWTGKERYTLSEHTEIVEMLAAGDAAGAEQALTRHLERSAGLYARQDTYPAVT